MTRVWVLLDRSAERFTDDDDATADEDTEEDVADGVMAPLSVKTFLLRELVAAGFVSIGINSSGSTC